MRKRAIKQLIIALVYLFILACVIILILYFQKPEPSCFDGIKNQDEEEIDCGGPCISCELVNIESLKVLWTEVIPSEKGFYDLAARIKNPNQNYGSGKISYKFEIYDYNDNFVSDYSGETFILPNQTKYIVNTKIASDASVYRANIIFTNVDWKKPFNYNFPEFAVKQKEYYFLNDESLGVSQAKAILVNKSNFDFEEIGIDVLLFDSLDNLIAVNNNEIRTLPTGQERDFIVTWFHNIDGNVSRIEVEPETNIFDSDNYVPFNKEGTEEFQKY